MIEELENDLNIKKIKSSAGSFYWRKELKKPKGESYYQKNAVLNYTTEPSVVENNLENSYSSVVSQQY